MSLLVVENIHFECWGGLRSTIMVRCSVYIGSNIYSDSKLDDGGEGDIVSYFSNRYKMEKKKNVSLYHLGKTSNIWYNRLFILKEDKCVLQGQEGRRKGDVEKIKEKTLKRTKEAIKEGC